MTTGGKGVVAHAGARLLCDLADGLGLTDGLSEAMAPTKKRRRGHDRGQVLVDLAVAIADGATTISDLRVLGQPAGASSATWRRWRRRGGRSRRSTPPRSSRIAAARASARARVPWAAGMDPGFYVIDIDGTLVNAHSDKQGAAPNYKHGFGFYPLMAFLDATGEALAALLAPGQRRRRAPPPITSSVLDAALVPAPGRPSRHAR